MGALALTMMLMGSVIPFATFCAPAIGGVLMLPVVMECGLKMAWLMYGTVSILALILVPEKEMALVFVLILGHYPLVKVHLERISSRAVRMLAKLAVFNGSVAVMYGLVLTLFPIPELSAEFAAMGAVMILVLLVTANVAFVVYDMALVNLARWYSYCIRPKLRFLR